MTLGTADQLISFRLKNVDGGPSPRAVRRREGAGGHLLVQPLPVRAGLGGSRRRDPARVRRSGRPVRADQQQRRDEVPRRLVRSDAARAKEKAYPYPYLLDSLRRSPGSTERPGRLVFLFDEARTLRYHGAPDDNADDPKAVTKRYLRDAIDALLADTAPARVRRPPKDARSNGGSRAARTPAPAVS